MGEVIDWHQADPPVVLSLALRLLKEGRLVAFPTESAYTVAASARDSAAVARLQEVVGQPEGGLAVAVPGPAEALDWVPALGRTGRRLARRCWPGPVTILCRGEAEHGLATRLPEAVQRRLGSDGGLMLRSPAHEAVLQVLRLLAGPLLLAEAVNGRPACSAEHAAEALGDQVELLIDAGPCRYGPCTTLVAFDGENWTVLREGVLSKTALEALLPCRIVFVCTGNTCRSPLAEALCKQLLSKRLGCSVAELPARGFLVLSAGLSAMMGGGAAPEAVETARELGADLAEHRSQPLTREMFMQADHVIAMTQSHLRALGSHGGASGLAPRLLAGDGTDIPDPIGAAPEVYRECARQILAHLQALLPELQ
jgi:L-threonylcarbamoyladenylate synthase